MWLETLAAAALAVTLPGTAYLATLSAAAVLAPRRSTRAPDAAALRVAIVVPAHQESNGVLRTLHSLRRETAGCPHTRIVVVADNCSDDTATVARAAGVEVLERHDPERRGKGHALCFAFDALAGTDWFIVIDADTDVEPGFLSAMRAAMTPGTAALQCRYGVRDPLLSARNTLADVALGGWNVLRPRGRAVLGLSCGILGNGFALSRNTLQAVPYSATSIVEDVEYHHLLVRAGLAVCWVDAAQVRGDMPPAGPAAGQQRARWEGGRLRLLTEQAPALLRDMAQGRWRMLDPLLDLLLLPLAWHVSLLGASALLALAALLLGGALGGAFSLLVFALVGLGTVVVHVGVSLVLIGAGCHHLRALLGVPAYVFWKLRLASATWRASRRNALWVRSARREH
jgi:cellulose synthase/poly-beta-1,6-N-acetylglucosamine synthase-like glycosyltransferase